LKTKYRIEKARHMKIDCLECELKQTNREKNININSINRKQEYSPFFISHSNYSLELKEISHAGKS
jgi:hypothetical protein